MQTKQSIERRSVRYYITGLEQALAEELVRVLEGHGCREANSPRAADIVFCAPRAQVLKPAVRQAAGRPVIAVSRIPETSLWLDALEAGAADYYAAPFENMHIRWMLDRHCGERASARAVA